MRPASGHTRSNAGRARATRRRRADEQGRAYRAHHLPGTAQRPAPAHRGRAGRRPRAADPLDPGRRPRPARLPAGGRAAAAGRGRRHPAGVAVRPAAPALRRCASRPRSRRPAAGIRARSGATRPVHPVPLVGRSRLDHARPGHSGHVGFAATGRQLLHARHRGLVPRPRPGRGPGGFHRRRAARGELLGRPAGRPLRRRHAGGGRLLRGADPGGRVHHRLGHARPTATPRSC